MKNPEIERHFKTLCMKLADQFGKEPDLQAILFLIGVDELNLHKTKFNKEEKQDLMHVGVCKVLSYSDYYELAGLDEEGWPHYNSLKPLTSMNLLEQEDLIKAHVVFHFQEINFLEADISL